MRKGAQLIEELRELVEQTPPQFQKKNGNGDEKGGGGGNSKATIKTLADTDYRDKDAFFKMVQLLKGLAANADKDETAKKYLSAVSDALTSAAKKVLGEDVIDEAVSLKFIGNNMDRVASYAKDAKAEFSKGNVKLGVMSMTDVLSELSHAYASLEDVDGRFGAVKKNVKDAIAQSIRFDKEL
jgi:hypothetical protein